MNKLDDLLFDISNQRWDSLVSHFVVEDIICLINYKGCMALAYDLFFKNFFSDEMQDFAVRLFFAIKKQYIVEWDQDWKNEAFLGNLCSMTWRYDEMYACYKGAYDKLSDPPSALLLLLAGCSDAPGKAPISKQEAIEYLQRAVNKKMTCEGALMMKGMIQGEEAYWRDQCLELEKNNIHIEAIIPDILLEQNRR